MNKDLTELKKEFKEKFGLKFEGTTVIKDAEHSGVGIGSIEGVKMDKAELIKELTSKVRVTWYHGTNNPKEFLRNGIYKRATEEYPNISDCVYLATTLEEARYYGKDIFEVYYNPLINPDKNNYHRESWQIRVYEPIDITKIKQLKELLIRPTKDSRGSNNFKKGTK